MEKERESQAGEAMIGAGGVRMEKLLLASASPRRAEILRAVGWEFEPLATHLDEKLLAGESAQEMVERLALEKAKAAARLRSGMLVLGADTTVVVGSSVLEKPRDAEDARRMLRLLNNGWHEVLTGVALVRDVAGALQRTVSHEITKVRFGRMSEAEIDWYVRSGEPMDKAGAYAVQGRASLFIEEIKGDYWNIVGLPVRLVYKLSGQINKE